MTLQTVANFYHSKYVLILVARIKSSRKLFEFTLHVISQNSVFYHDGTVHVNSDRFMTR